MEDKVLRNVYSISSAHSLHVEEKVLRKCSPHFLAYDKHAKFIGGHTSVLGVVLMLVQSVGSNISFRQDVCP